ncbi:MAG: PEP-CTERM sorting domain-containing protein [Phycisphaerae bacterium]
MIKHGFFMLVAIVLMACSGKTFGNVSMNFDSLTISPNINFSNLYSGSPPSELANLATYQIDTPGAWYGANYVPDKFGLTSMSGQNVLQMGISPSQYQYNPAPLGSSSGFGFSDFQGMKYDTGLSGTVQTMSVQLYVDPSWAANPNAIVNVGLEATGVNTGNSVVGKPTVAYLNLDGGISPEGGGDYIYGYSNPGFYYYDYKNVAGNPNPEWEYLAAGTSGFNTIGFTLTVGQGIQYSLNGTAVGSLYSDSAMTTLQNLELYARNSLSSSSAPDQMYTFDNLSATSVPEPPTAALVFFGGIFVFVAGLLRRKFAHQRI